ncbi:MAG TPA: EF-hand domain-containing protein [Spirochaetota bacterium]|nr:EF-hand domain-containing protein [Spirochaetota bacterium]HPV39572.1 EF-hand domain-containing protein [Spirochaetota bacterium]
MKRFLLCLATLALFPAICAVAQSRPEPPRGPKGINPITMMDADGDGKVSLSEWTQFHESMFNEMDTDGDGYLTAAELQKRPGPPR